MNILAIGEVLWDIFEDGEHLGGAALNFSAHARKLGHSVSFVSAVGRDERGRRALEAMQGLGLSTRFVHEVRGHPTGTVTVSLNSAGVPDFVIHRPVAYDFPELSDFDFAELAASPPEWIYFGTLYQTSPAAKALTSKLLESFPQARRFYDVNLRKDSYTTALLRELLPLATVAKLNDQEADAMQSLLGWSYQSLEDFCRGTAAQFGWQAVSVTRGEAGCAMLVGGNYVEAPGHKVPVADTVGAGDAAAAAFVHGLAQGWPAAAIADFTNRVGALISSRPGGTPDWTVQEAEALGRA